MDLVNVTAIERFARKHRDSAPWLANWIEVARASDWNSIHDVRKHFPSADGVPLKSRVVVTVFNVKGNEYRLLTVIQYSMRRIVILDVMTHEEYDREQWK